MADETAETDGDGLGQLFLSENTAIGWYIPELIEQLILHPGFVVFWDRYRRQKMCYHPPR